MGSVGHASGDHAPLGERSDSGAARARFHFRELPARNGAGFTNRVQRVGYLEVTRLEGFRNRFTVQD